MTKSIGAFAIILNDNQDKVLLVKRKDGPIWDLPGGMVEISEVETEGVIRETEEETGYLIDIERKVGEYRRIQLDDIQHIYLCKIRGGHKINDGEETSKVDWFDISRLPKLMVPNRKMQIKDCMCNQSAVKKDLRISGFELFIKKYVKRLIYFFRT